jgi:hypothetical protein
LIDNLNPEQGKNHRCRLVKHLKFFNSHNQPFQAPPTPDWSRCVFVGYSWFRDPRYKGDENPPF